MLISSTRSGDRIRYRPVATVKMKQPYALNVMRRLFGGTVVPVTRVTRPAEAAILNWQLAGAHLLCPLRLMLPFLQIKGQQAEVIVGLLEQSWPQAANGRGIDWTPEASAAWEVAKQRISTLNTPGMASPDDSAIALLVGDQWMTPQRDLFGERWTRFSDRWPKSGSLASGTCSARPRSGHPISASVSSFWPTATAMDAHSSGASSYPTTGKHHAGTTLTDAAVRMWPTPDAMVAQDGEEPESWLARRETLKAKGYNGNGAGLPLAMAAQMWPTPQTDSFRSRGGERRDEAGLDRQARSWAMPSAQMWRSENPDQSPDHSPPLSRQVLRTPTPGAPSSPAGPTSRRRLNPLFVEWLMGWPTGWTACEPLGTEWSRWWLLSRSWLSLLGRRWQ